MKINETTIDKVITSYYLRNTDIFIENELNVKLNWFRKKLIRLAMKGVQQNAKG